MRFENGPDNMAGNQLDGGVTNRDPAVSASKVTRIPFKIDHEIIVSSLH